MHQRANHHALARSDIIASASLVQEEQAREDHLHRVALLDLAVRLGAAQHLGVRVGLEDALGARGRLQEAAWVAELGHGAPASAAEAPAAEPIGRAGRLYDEAVPALGREAVEGYRALEPRALAMDLAASPDSTG